jgi:uncharacterized circularly permuted ATP-grasp superfamily protein
MCPDLLAGRNADSRLLGSYAHDGFFDEMFDASGRVRPHYAAVADAVDALGSGELDRLARMRDAVFRTNGITFTVYGDDGGDGTERTFPLDLLPRVIPAAQWRRIEVGLVQRVTALNRFLDDLYVGDQAVLHDGIIPRWLVMSSEGYRREAMGIAAGGGARCLIAGIDLVRDDQGRYLVLEDNVRNPSGVSYVLENRATMTRLMPESFAAQRVRPVDHYPLVLLGALRNASLAMTSDPTIVVLTPGVYNSAYFEHAFLARQMGVELVEGRDLEVDDHVVYMRTTRGRRRVDVIYRRIDDDYLDPVVFRNDSSLGVPGLLAAARSGNVTVVNAIGNGVADDKSIYPYVDSLIRYYLGEEPLLDQVPTYLLWDDDQCHEALGRLDELVVKPVDGAGGYGLLVGPHATAAELDDFRKRILANRRGFIAQQTVDLSRHPTYIDGTVVPRHVDFRPFVVTGERTEVLPGGLTRVALREGSLVVNSSQGGGSKDTWVLEPDPADLGELVDPEVIRTVKEAAGTSVELPASTSVELPASTSVESAATSDGMAG